MDKQTPPSAHDGTKEEPQAPRAGAISGPSQDLFEQLLGALPGDLKGWRGLIEQAADHVSLATGSKRRVAILGPANAGKSTLYNQLLTGEGEQAAVSAVPGTTRKAQAGDSGVFTVVDTPGVDAAGTLGETEKARAMESARRADVIVILFDAASGVGAPEVNLYAQLSILGKPMVVAINKMDLVPKGERPVVLGRAAAALSMNSEKLLSLSAKHGTGVERVLLEIAWIEPGIVAALAEALPAYRWKLAQTVITRSASTAAVIAMTPLPFLSFVPLLGIQAAMILSLARIYQYEMNLARARELIATFGVALLGRTLFYELSKLGGPPGWAIAAGVAAGTTAALGYAGGIWFERGEKLDPEALRRIASVTSSTMIDRMKNLGRRKPGEATLRERVVEVLDEMKESEAAAPDAAAEAVEPNQESG